MDIFKGVISILLAIVIVAAMIGIGVFLWVFGVALSLITAVIFLIGLVAVTIRGWWQTRNK